MTKKERKMKNKHSVGFTGEVHGAVASIVGPLLLGPCISDSLTTFYPTPRDAFKFTVLHFFRCNPHAFECLPETWDELNTELCAQCRLQRNFLAPRMQTRRSRLAATSLH